ncbi:uncharacterized protein B0H64DRAFT_220748 [Chaetomium fimeti]|uniref:Uncharacterized protein n=1 Tax=Chaetomium fimeti TaxID=1854472 RepID=A0AAE0H902_9PEZI|nr:hypothetical protein B0H64DRAFT_220748 [Chaetomium fimeti]
MASSRHVGAITELNLSTCQTNTLVDRINAVPGLKTSAAFLTFLRANLVLLDSTMSNASTPTLGPHTPQALPPVSPSPLGTSPTQAALDDNIPPLSLELLTSREDKAAALKLVADSIAQQRQAAALHLVFHPLPLAAILAVLAAIYRYAWTQNSQNDLGTVLMLVSGAIMTYLTAIRFFTSGYLRAAEEVSWDFLTAGRDGDEEDLVLGTRYGPDVVGAVVLRLERPTSSSDGNGGGGTGGGGGRRKAHSRQNSFKLKGGRGVIRAWTTRLRYRGRGVGGDLLREAARVTRERCGKDAEVGFAKEHANSIMVLPEMFNSPFRKGEMRAARALERVLGERDGRRR